MMRRKTYAMLLLLALAPYYGRALFLILMEIIGNMQWREMAAVFLIGTAAFGLLRCIKLFALYALIVALIWLSLIGYAPHETKKTELGKLTQITETLIEYANKNYTADFELERTIRKAERIMNYSSGRLHAFVRPDIMDKLKLSGIFLPFTGKAYINTNEEACLLPFVLVHELSHAQGILNEGQDNIEALKRCIESGEKEFVYSASLYALKYALEEIKEMDIDKYYRLRERADAPVLYDLNRFSADKRAQKSPFTNYAQLVNGLYAVIP